MELLLTQDVEGLGQQGEVVTVARGYGRNFLIPKGLATVPNEQKISEVRALAEKNAVVAAAEKADRMEVAKVMASVSLRIPMKAGKEGHLYGSVGPRQLVDLLEAEGHVVEEKQVVLEQPLKEVGEFDVTISLHPEVQVPIKVVIVNEEE